MSVFRAVASCPVCNLDEEVWYYNGALFSNTITGIKCQNCSHRFDPSKFLSKLLDLRKDLTVSTAMLVS